MLPKLGERGEGWVAAQVVLIAAILLSAFTGSGWPASLAPVAYSVGALLLAFGLGLLATGAIGLGSALTPFPAPRRDGELRTEGIYRLVRHPMYGGGIFVGLGWSIIFATFVGAGLTVLLALFADLKARREEYWLGERHAAYSEYRSRTRHRFIPFLW